MKNDEFYSEILVKKTNAGDTIIKYFAHERIEICASKTMPNTIKTEMEINQYCQNNELEIASVSCDRDIGVYVVFKKKINPQEGLFGEE